MPDSDRATGRRTIGIGMAASAGLMVLAAVLVFLRAIPVSETSRMLVGGVLAAVGVVDLLLAWYFIVSEQS